MKGISCGLFRLRRCEEYHTTLKLGLTSLDQPASKSFQETRSSSQLTGSSGLFSVEDYSFPILDRERCPAFLMSTVSEFSYPQSSPSYVLLLECLHLDNAIGHILHLTLDSLVRASAHCKESLAVQPSNFRTDSVDE